jgi:protein phosphatase
VADQVEPDLFAAQLQPNDFLLLASDGLTRYVKPEEIAQAASMGLELAAICNALIEHAKQRGGADNITCILLHAVETPAGAGETAPTATETQPGTSPGEWEAFTPAI